MMRIHGERQDATTERRAAASTCPIARWVPQKFMYAALMIVVALTGSQTAIAQSIDAFARTVAPASFVLGPPKSDGPVGIQASFELHDVNVINDEDQVVRESLNLGESFEGERMSEPDDETICGEAEEVVRSFFRAWSRLNVEELLSFFGPQPVWQNMPDGEPMQGASSIRSTLDWVREDWTQHAKVDFEILSMACKNGLVFFERIDHVESLGRKIDLPVAGVIEVQSGKINTWRDYYDAATYTAHLPPRIEWQGVQK